MEKGYVVGSDPTPDGQKIIWKVRVNNPESPYYEHKFVVASIHNNLQLAPGLDVEFEIGTVGEQSLRAVDVRLKKPELNPCVT